MLARNNVLLEIHGRRITLTLEFSDFRIFTQCQRQCQFVQRIAETPPPTCAQYRANKIVFHRRLKADSVAFGLRTGSGRPFQADGLTHSAILLQ